MNCVINNLVLLLSLSSIGTADSRQKPLQVAPTYEAWLDPDFDNIVESTLRQWHVPGLSIAVIENGKITSKVAHSITTPHCAEPSLSTMAE